MISRAAADAMVTEVEVWSVRVAGWGAAAAHALAPLAEVIAVPDGAFDGAALLISVPQDGDIDRDHATRWSRPAPRCAPRPSSAATRPAIRSPAKGDRPVPAGG